MDLTRHVRGGDHQLSEIYQHDLQLYEFAPSDQVLLHDFEEIALERLRVLKIIDTVNLRGFNKLSDEWRKNFYDELDKQGLKTLLGLYQNRVSSGLKNNYELRQRDHISHFILCLTFCRTDELRNWFLNREIELFQIRFDTLTPEGLQTFLRLNKIDFKPISDKEKQLKLDRLRDTFQYMTSDNFNKMDFYKVPFRKVIDLVRSRRVLLEKGQCYVAATDINTFLASKLRQTINHNLAVMRQSLPETCEDRRLDAVLKCLLEQYEAGNYRPSTNTTDTLRIEDLNDVSKKSFPPCMRRLHEALTTKHHLRHGGRQQYQLFLKGAGLPMDECLRFWRSEFLKVIAPEKFEKEHAYNIRHNYGKEGNCTNYSPYGCNKIIQSQPGPDDYHGCPFRHCKPQDLKRLLLSYGIGTKGLEEVMEHTDNQHFTLACQKLFVLTHENEKAMEFGMCHPNQYYNESRSLITSNKPQLTAGNTPSSNYNSPSATPGFTKSVTPGTSRLPPSQSTPLSSRGVNSGSTHPMSSPSSTPASRRTLPLSKPNNLSSRPLAEIKVQESANEVSDWLDEADDDVMEQLVAMETQ